MGRRVSFLVVVIKFPGYHHIQDRNYVPPDGRIRTFINDDARSGVGHIDEGKAIV